MTPSPYWGDEPIWDSQADIHNPMMDEKGRVWFTARVRPPANNPAFCKQGSEHPSAKAFPLNSSTRQMSMYDPETGKFTLIDLCFPTHHLIFAEDANNTLWSRAGSAGWAWSAGSTAESSRRPATRQRRRAGRRSCSTPTATASATTWVEPNQPVDPAKDKRVAVNFYSVVVNPQDGSVWGQALSPFPGYVVRFDPKTQLSRNL